MSLPDLNPDLIIKNKRIGRGRFGEVYEIETQNKFALKECEFLKAEDLENFKTEIEKLRKKNIKNVVKSLSSFSNSSKSTFSYSMNLMNKNLENLVKTRADSMSLSELNPILKDIITGIYEINIGASIN